MAKARQSIMERRNARRKHTATITRRQTMTKVGAGLVLFASAAVLTQVSTPTITVSAQTTKSQFLELVAPYARDIAGKNDLYASVMIAQAALESGWGNSGLSSAPNYNLFGIKGSYNGNTVHFDTLEDDGTGNYYQINDGFRKYSNYGESLQDYADLLTGNNDPSSWRYNFYKGARVSETNSYQDATAHLTGRYATDTSYASKLNAIIEQNNLTQYDTRRGSSNTSSVAPSVSTPSVSGGGSYTVQAGDSYWRIANKYGISIQELQRLNGTSDYFLYPGQSLKVPDSSTNATANNTSASSASVTPSQPSTPSTSSVSGGGSYTVQAGDSYWRIANKYGISIQELQRLNGTSDYFLYPGQSLKVPGSSTNATANNTPASSASVTPSQPSEPAPSAPSVSGTGSYTVQAGDSYWRIANKHGISIQELQRLNGTSDYFLYPGQVIKVSGAVSAPVVESAPAEPASVETPVTTEVAAPSAPAAPTGGSTYVAQAGDTLYGIAQRHGLNVYKLIELNGGTTIYIGQTIQLN